MKIYDETKTKELNESAIDYEKGYLKQDKLVMAHHDAVEAQEAVYKDREVVEANGGVSIYKDLVTPAVEAREAYDDYEDVQIFVPYTEEELTERKRYKRKPLLEAFDKWEKAVLRGRELDDEIVMQWYRDLLDLQESAFENVPERIKYYL